ncbi:hypothetical protein L195_g015428 [Trifolium pratense]|uniref:Uncharacterized protein n=1 Tax=Trifolium pratense TaxID=57577 RepID=A0A2K3MNI4_TRIPR|nr:hypothetical protein L195_g015428 [Trifolium pratense]
MHIFDIHLSLLVKLAGFLIDLSKTNFVQINSCSDFSLRKGKSEIALQAENNNSKKWKGKWNGNKGRGGHNNVVVTKISKKPAIQVKSMKIIEVVSMEIIEAEEVKESQDDEAKIAKQDDSDDSVIS